MPAETVSPASKPRQMELNAAGARLELGKAIIEGNQRELAMLVDFLNKNPHVTITKFTEARSNRANRYMWALCTDIGNAIWASKDDVYRDAVKRRGPYKDYTGLDEGHAKTLQTAWSKIGLGWITEEDYDIDGEHKVVRCYYGSSSYNKKQMANLLDDLVQEARDLGLETYDDQRINSLLEEYDAQDK